MKGKKILIVDDDPDMLQLLNRALGKAGFEVVAAKDGLSAVAQARAEKPDAIVLDLGLPVGDGFSVLERLRSMIPGGDVPVMILTARDQVLEARAAGADGFLRKPIDPEVLVERLNGLLAA